MTSKSAIRSLLLTLFAMAMITVAKADVYIYVNQNTHSVGKSVAVPGMSEADIYPDLPVESWYISDPYGSPVLHADIDATMAKGTYFVGQLHDGTWVDIEDVYVVIQ